MLDFSAIRLVRGKRTSTVILILLYVNSGVVVPAKAGIQLKETGFRIRSGMTEYLKSSVKH